MNILFRRLATTFHLAKRMLAMKSSLWKLTFIKIGTLSADIEKQLEIDFTEDKRSIKCYWNKNLAENKRIIKTRKKHRKGQHT